MVGPLSTELVLAALATCRHYLAELRLRLQNGLQPELRQIVYFAPASSVELPLEPLAASTRDEEPQNVAPRSSSGCFIASVIFALGFAALASSRVTPVTSHDPLAQGTAAAASRVADGAAGCRRPRGGWRRAGRAAGGVRGGRGQLRAADGAAGCRGRAADGEASCGLCGRRAGQLPWRRLAGSEEAGDEHGGWCGEFGRQGVQGIRRWL